MDGWFLLLIFKVLKSLYYRGNQKLKQVTTFWYFLVSERKRVYNNRDVVQYLVVGVCCDIYHHSCIWVFVCNTSLLQDSHTSGRILPNSFITRVSRAASHTGHSKVHRYYLDLHMKGEWEQNKRCHREKGAVKGLWTVAIVVRGNKLTYRPTRKFSRFDSYVSHSCENV